MNLQTKTLVINNERIVCEYKLASTNVVILHGAGASNSSRFYSIAQEILRQQLGVILFDFSGQGQSGGTLAESSLEHRKAQATSVITTLTDEKSSLLLVGFSMSGQTTCDLLPIFGNRIKSILLGCPAAYAYEACSIPFGNPDFTRILRTPDSWSTSTAFKNLSAFRGKTTIAVGSNDTVIPKGVIDSFAQAANNPNYIEYNNVSHALAVWLSEHPKIQTELITKLVAY